VIVGMTQDQKLSCDAYFGLVTTGWVLLYAALVCKTMRIDKIFNGKSLDGYPDSRVAKHTAGLVLLHLVLLGVQLGTGGWYVTARPVLTTEGQFDATLQCSVTPQSEMLALLMVGFLFVLTLMGAYLAFKTRAVRDDFNESKALSYAVAVTTLVMVVLVPVYLVSLGGSPDFGMALKGVVLSMLPIAQLLLIYIPKIIMVFNPVETGPKVYVTSMGGGAKSKLGAKSSLGGSSVGDDADDTMALKAEIQRLKDELVKAKNANLKKINEDVEKV